MLVLYVQREYNLICHYTHAAKYKVYIGQAWDIFVSDSMKKVSAQKSVVKKIIFFQKHSFLAFHYVSAEVAKSFSDGEILSRNGSSLFKKHFTFETDSH